MYDTPLRLVRLLLRLGIRFGVFTTVSRWIFGQRIAAVMGLTWKAALRFRLFLVVAVLLLASVVGLPLLIKDDGTARGFTQILLTYTLSTISALLGLSTLWLACGTLARDIEDCQMQVVAVKPIARWQIWLGKWLGIMSLNAALLALSGASVYGLLQWRANRLPADQQKILRNEVLVARGSAKPNDFKKEIDAATDRLFQERLQKHPLSGDDLLEAYKQIREQIKAELQMVPSGSYGQWEINLGSARRSLQDQPLYLRIKFNTADRSASGTFSGLWRVGVPRKTQLWQSEPMSLAPDTFHEFQVPPGLLDEDGVLTIGFINANNTTLLFPLEDGIEVLYREGGFGLNFARGLGIIFCWMGLLAAVGLAAASFLSFPVAAFFALGLLTMVLASGTMAGAVSEGTIANYNAEKGTKGWTPADVVVIPTFKAVLKVISLAKDFSPIDSLSTGRSITWGQLGLAFGQIILLLSGAIGLFGIFVFSRRELATAQGTQ
jgi:ABC-type transport system involved in multi-copper enzyme maturation permease subunit